MLGQDIRQAVLTLVEKGLSRRKIARALKVSRGAVAAVLAKGDAEVPRPIRPSKGEPYRERIVELFKRCRGNLVRVHEGLVAEGAQMSYPALTAFCRRHGIGQVTKLPSGHYTFAPGAEMQHDTSPHRIEIGGKIRKAQTASVVLCYSRMLFFQMYPTFTRFECKVFLHDALEYLGCTCKVCMIDNTHVVVSRGTGSTMVPAPEMDAFSQRYGFKFEAHEKGDANRSARVERPFHFIENNFLVNRTFETWQDLNAQARTFCDRVNSSRKRHLDAKPTDLFATEREHMKPLPVYVPEVYRLFQRTVNVDGYVLLHTNRYSVPAALLGRQVEVRETRDRVEVWEGPRLITPHERMLEPLGKLITKPEHQVRRANRRQGALVEEAALQKMAPALSDYVAKLKAKSTSPTLALRQLVRMLREYPREPLLTALSEAARYGLYDLSRVERMALKRIGHDYFQIQAEANDE